MRKLSTKQTIILSQLLILVVFLLLTCSNELFDLAHLVLNDTPTSISQRRGEIIVELVIFTLIMFLEFLVLWLLFRRIRLLEGLLPICASCKKIRHDDDSWSQIEKYISEHSHANFTHTVCPTCAHELYPEVFADSEKLKAQ